MNINYEGLIDVTHLIIPEEINTYFNDNESIQLYNTCFYLMEEFVRDHITFISDPDFQELFDENIHDRSIELNNGWKVILGRGLDIWQKTGGWYDVNEYIQEKRICKACEITFLKN